MRRLWVGSLAVGLAAVGVTVGVLWLFSSDHYLFLPDPASPVDPIVKVPGETADGDDGAAGIYYVDVLVRRASVFERLFPGIRRGSTLVPEEEFNPERLSDRDRRRQSLQEMSASQQVAIAVALRELGYAVDPAGAEVRSVREGAPADGVLFPGDVIVEARGRSVASPEELRDAFAGVEPGERVDLVVERAGVRRNVTVRTQADPDDPERAIMGIQVQPELEFPVDVDIDAGGVGGPSAGLAFALDVLDELGLEVDRGRRIAVTGALDLDGHVVEIGGVKQKAIGARDAGADVFVVPEGNAEEARRYAEDLEIVAVGSFDEALEKLGVEQ
jgi:PDZ domain-containing protein